MTLDILKLNLSDLYSKYHQLVIHQDGITYFITDGRITQTFHDTYQGAKPYGVYTDNGVELWPMNYMDSSIKTTRQSNIPLAPTSIPSEYDYDESDQDDYFNYKANSNIDDDEDLLSKRKKSKAKKR